MPYQGLSLKKQRGKHRNSIRIAIVAGTMVFVSAVIIVLILLFNLDFVVNYLVAMYAQKRIILAAAVNSCYRRNYRD